MLRVFIYITICHFDRTKIYLIRNFVCLMNNCIQPKRSCLYHSADLTEGNEQVPLNILDKHGQAKRVKLSCNHHYIHPLLAYEYFSQTVFRALH
jgi:hypothetical protein